MGIHIAWAFILVGSRANANEYSKCPINIQQKLAVSLLVHLLIDQYQLAILVQEIKHPKKKIPQNLSQYKTKQK